MGFRRRLTAAFASCFLRHAPAREAGPEEIARADFSTSPGGKGLRLTERLRDAFRGRWLRLRRRRRVRGYPPGKSTPPRTT